MFETPELELADAEAKGLADAVAKVSALYDTKMNPRVLAWMNLAMVAGGIYGTRVWAIRARLNKDAEKAPPAPNVVDLFGLNYGAAIPER